MKKYGSFQEWSAAGFTVCAGSRHVFREKGVPQFTEAQVKPFTGKRSPKPLTWSKVNREQEEAAEFEEIHGNDAYGVLGADF